MLCNVLRASDRWNWHLARYKLDSYLFAVVLHSKGLKISKSKNVCPERLRWGLGNYECVGKAHSIETLNYHWNTLTQERSFLRIGYAKRGSSANFCNEAVSLVWQMTKSLGKTCDWWRAYCTWLSFSQTRPLQHFLSVAQIGHVGRCQCVSNCHISRGTTPRLPWYQRQAIGSLSVVSAETLRFLDGWCFCPDQGAVTQVVEPSTTLNSA